MKEIFLKWLSDGMNSGYLSINTSSSFMHVVPEGLLLMTPLTFRAFVKDSLGENQNYTDALKGLKRSDIFIVNGDSYVFNYEVKSQRVNRKNTVIQGFVLSEPEKVLNLDRALAAVNPALSDTDLSTNDKMTVEINNDVFSEFEYMAKLLKCDD